MSEERERKQLSYLLKGKGILNPCHTGVLDEHVKCIREYGVNFFFYTKDEHTIMIDAGYLDYPKLSEKLKRMNIPPKSISEILITHCDPDHVGAIDDRSEGLFSSATVYMSHIENRYVTGESTRKLLHLKPIRRPKISQPISLLDDRQTVMIGNIKVQGVLVPGHTEGMMAYIIDDKYLFTGDCIALGPDGGYNFMWFLCVDYKKNIKSVKRLQQFIEDKKIIKAYTAHTGITTDMKGLFAHITKNRKILFKCGTYNKEAPYDLYAQKE